MNQHLEQAWQRLKKRLEEIGSTGGSGGIAIAFSGGLDSRFLTHACLHLGLDVLALHFNGPHIQADEDLRALEWLRNRNVPFRTARADVLALPAVRFTSPDRCYHCKRFAFSQLTDLMADEPEKMPVCDGTGFSDLGEYRPGRRALAELGVLSPLAEAGLSKNDIRGLAKELGLDNPEQPGQTCLLTRFDYGLEATPALLDRLARAELELSAAMEELCLPSLKSPESPARLEFRLRLLADTNGKARPELHLKLTELQLLALMRAPGWSAVSALPARHGFADCPVLALPNLSGFFDRKRA